MSRKTEIFEQVLTQPFNNDNFVGFVREFLNNVEMVAPTRFLLEKSNFSFYVAGYNHIANYAGNDGNKIAIFSVALNKGDTVERARGIQRNFIKILIEKGNFAGALVAFYTKDAPEKWRLSFIRMDYEFSKGKVTEKLTPAKRYSYLVGKGEPCITAQQRLMPIFMNDTKNPDLDELEEAFSVEKVTKEFFNLYCEKYHQLREYLEGNEDFMQEAKIRNFTSEQFAKKLLGQIVFLYFIQKKGWLGVGVWPDVLSEKEYNNVFYVKGASGKIIKEYLPQVYTKRNENLYVRITSELDKIPDDAEEVIANYMVNSKKWGEGSKEFVKILFEFCVARNRNFFNDYLEPLFYDTLNRYRGEMAYCTFLHSRIPFLNGGLFEEIAGYDWKHNNFSIPNELFSNEIEKGGYEADGILDIFNRYNFTMNEDEPMEREVAIDPEMLGKVFENLLDVSDRKSKGAFYTPREIVHYMCQESLTNYLVNKTKIVEADIRDFITNGEYYKDLDTEKTKKVCDEEGEIHYELDKERDLLIPETIFCFKKNINRLKEIDILLSNVKVADLAVGSGAFPLGMLNEIVKARENLSTYMAIEMNAFNKKSFYSYDRKPYDIKVNTIRNCIFACDIDPSAVDIAKLRLWLSIVIDDEIDNTMNTSQFRGNSKPNQLPNLDCNIICGNTLIEEFAGNKLITESVHLNNESEDSQISMYQGGVDSLIKELIRLQDKYFFIKEHSDKIDLKKEIQRIYDQIVLEQLQGDLEEKYYEATKMSSQPFILWQLYFPKVFRDNGGFDIVIGNPPYVGQSGNKEIFREVKMTELGKRFHQRRMDFHYFFYHKGIDLLRNDGYLMLITTNYFLDATNADKLRADIFERTQIMKIINFNELKIFESATGQHNLIMLLNKGTNKNCEVHTSIVNRKGFASSKILENIFNGTDEQTEYNTFLNSELFSKKNGQIIIKNILDDAESILKKMTSMKSTLGDVAIINQGIVTGCNKISKKHLSIYQGNWYLNQGIFVLSEQEVNLLGLNEDESELIKPWFKNSDIHKWYTEEDTSERLIYYATKNEYKNVDKIKKYLEQFKIILINRNIRTGSVNENQYEHYLEDNYEISYVMIASEMKKGNYYCVSYAREKNIFENPKIVVPQRSKKNTFGYTDKIWYGATDVYFINQKMEDISLKFLLGLLNSKLYYFWLFHRGKRKGDTLELFLKPLSEIPIPLPTAEIQKEIENISDNLIYLHKNSKKKEIEQFEVELNSIIYNIFGLSENEIEIVEKTYVF